MIGPVVPLGGVAGLAFLDRTLDRQVALFNRSPEIERAVAYFRENAAQATTAEALVRDTRLLEVAVGAFGLDDELPKRAFLRKVLEEGTLDPRALANRLADPAWAAFAEGLGFGNGGGRLGSESVREDLIARFRTRQFERALGEQDVNLRLALNFRREIAAIADGAAARGSDSAERAAWFRVLGSRPLRAVVEAAFGLPESFGTLDVDRQRIALESRVRSRYGSDSVSVFKDPAVVDDAVRRFLLRAEIQAGPSLTTPGAAALSILQASSLGAGARAGLFTASLR